MKSKERKQFLEGQLARYENTMEHLMVGSEEYDAVKAEYLEIYKELYPDKSIWNKVIDVAKIVIPAAVSVGLGVFAYHKNENLESKDGDVWKEARRR